MPTLAGRARPIEKFAEAVAKCGPEVCILVPLQCWGVMMNGMGALLNSVDRSLGSTLWEVYRGRLPVYASGYVQEGIHGAEGLLSGLLWVSLDFWSALMQLCRKLRRRNSSSNRLKML